MKHMLVQAHYLGLLDDQDSQHMLKQLKGVFPWGRERGRERERERDLGPYGQQKKTSNFEKTTAKRPESQGLKTSAEMGHGSSAPLWLHRNTVRQAFWELSYPWGEGLPNSDNFLNPRLSGLLSFPET